MECCCYETIGLVFLIYLSLRLSIGFYGFVTEYITASYPDFSKFGKWSVVTGATDGIGKATVLILAKLGQNIVLISRSEDKLKATKEELLKVNGNIEVKYVAVDFTDNVESIYPKIEACVKDLDIGFLLNNVGISYDYSEYFLDLPNLSKKVQDIIRANCISVVKMTEIVLPRMVASKRGVIMNVSSASSINPCPMLSLYGASKDFVNHFTQSLSYECLSKGIHFQTVMPLYVSTKLSKIRKPSFFVPTATAYATSMLKTVGKTRHTFGYWTHSLQGTVIEMLPGSIFAMFMMNHGKQIRAKALKKLAEKQKTN